MKRRRTRAESAESNYNESADIAARLVAAPLNPPYGLLRQIGKKVYNPPQGEKMTEPNNDLNRILDLAHMVLVAVRSLPSQLNIMDKSSYPPSWRMISGYLQSKTNELPQKIVKVEVQQYALSDLINQGQRYLEAIMHLAPMPYQTRSATMLGRLLWELHINAAWMNQSGQANSARIFSWLEWQRFMIARCNNLPDSEDAIKKHLESEKVEKKRLVDKYGKNHCFHCGINQKAKAIGEYLWYVKMYRTYSLLVHGELPASPRLLDPAGVLFFSVKDCYFLAKIFANTFEGADLFDQVWRPITERINLELDA